MPELNDHGQSVGDVVPEWSPRPWPHPVRLQGRYVTVEPLAAGHAPALFDALCGPGDAALWTYRAQRPPTSAEEMAGLVDRLMAEPEMVTFALVPAGRAPAGLASYARIDRDTGQIEVAAVLFARSLQRTAAATEAIHLLIRRAVDELGYRRFEWKCDSLNEPSRRAAERLGFRYEGRFRNHLIVKGRNRDTDWFSIIDTEWPAIRAEHERWLDPANFDASGTQRTPLRVPR